MPKTPEPAKPKAQPWRAVWPAPESASHAQSEKKLAAPGSLNGMYGFNDKGQGVTSNK